MIAEQIQRINGVIDEIIEDSYALGRESALEDLEYLSDKYWNADKKKSAELLRRVAKKIREGKI